MNIIDEIERIEKARLNLSKRQKSAKLFKKLTSLLKQNQSEELIVEGNLLIEEILKEQELWLNSLEKISTEIDQLVKKMKNN